MKSMHIILKAHMIWLLLCLSLMTWQALLLLQDIGKSSAMNISKTKPSFHKMMRIHFYLIPPFQVYMISILQFYRCTEEFQREPTVSSIYVESFTDKHLPQVSFSKNLHWSHSALDEEISIFFTDHHLPTIRNPSAEKQRASKAGSRFWSRFPRIPKKRQ